MQDIAVLMFKARESIRCGSDRGSDSLHDLSSKTDHDDVVSDLGLNEVQWSSS
jgi:hypothetical protein